MAGSWSTHPLPTNWATTTKRVLARDNRTCYLCHQPATEVDHITPRWKGGGNSDSNLAAICQPCHRSKTAREANEARRLRYQRTRNPPPHPGTL